MKKNERKEEEEMRWSEENGKGREDPGRNCDREKQEKKRILQCSFSIFVPETYFTGR